ncbi:metalloproteinase G1-MEROPS peptidase family M44 (clan ME) [Squirrelpox virus]|uniref:Metalloendopeptidase n=1 Tax=Squirrelpox virus TaxID=240426 RepID=U3UB96_9POXV|nr:metalloproteinase G1-MEROPS peptidase family M44 (clan ME) [Squirrelpox virus]CCD83227.1 metalloproteinase G1-MEROPS peptidase family M44 (clan ME) [Squirrelpox virus]
MIVLANGVRLFVNESMAKDIFVGIANFGFENDVADVLGVSHLLEHVLISFDPGRFVANATTSRNCMSFWCRAVDARRGNDAVRLLTSWFFPDGRLRVDFSGVRIADYIHELENEYYFRNEILHCLDVITFLCGGDLYNGGRLCMLERADEVRDLLAKRMRRIAGPNVVIFVKRLGPSVLSLLSRTFGALPRCPDSVMGRLPKDIGGKIVMMPTPFYTMMVHVPATVDNVLAILYLSEAYHLVDFEAVGASLYVSISFVHEDDFDRFMRGEAVPRFGEPGALDIGEGDDFLMNLYLCFPWMKNDILDYVAEFEANKVAIVRGLERDIRDAVLARDLVAVYPNFSKSVFNAQDSQRHRLVVMDAQPCAASEALGRRDAVFMRKQPTRDEMFVRYGDTRLLDVVAMAVGQRSLTLRRTRDGVRVQHRMSATDMRSILESDVFLKYSRSRPAALYQYILLDFFTSGRSIEDILANRESALVFHGRGENRLVFGRRTKFAVTSGSSFVCGVVRGGGVSEDWAVGLMWRLKRKGLIYSMDHTKLRGRRTMFLFAFSIYPEKVYSFLTKDAAVKDHCLVVSTVGEEDFSALYKSVTVRLG